MNTYFSPHSNKKIVKKAQRISRKIGVNQRYFTRRLDLAISAASPTAPELCQKAISSALQHIDTSSKIGYLIGHTASPYTLMPPNIAWVAENLAHQGPYLELRQACTGFANALQIAAPMLNGNPSMPPVTIVGSETGSVYFDAKNDQHDIEQLINYVQMGDGAGAVILGSDDQSNKQIISDIYLGHIGLDKDSGFYMEGGSRQPSCKEKTVQQFTHNTSHVLEYGSQLFRRGLESVYQRGYHLDDFDFIIPHQANGHMAEYLSKELKINKDRIVVDADKVGNLGSAAIWYSFDQLIKSGNLSRGSKVLVLGAEATKYLYGGFVYTH